MPEKVDGEGGGETRAWREMGIAGKTRVEEKIQEERKRCVGPVGACNADVEVDAPGKNQQVEIKIKCFSFRFIIRLIINSIL